jgi:xanthine dehydrogenase accessory factor
MNNIFKNLLEQLESGEQCVMAVIFARAGSAPRTAGARMLVRQDGSIAGTIGGGLLEARVQQTAALSFGTHATQIEEFSLTGADASQMEMICGGEVAVLIEYVDGSYPGQIDFYRAVAAAAADRRRSWLVTVLPVNGDSKPVSHVLLISRSVETGESLEAAASSTPDLELDLKGLSTFVQRPQVSGSRYPVLFTQNQNRMLVEPLGMPGRLFLFGGGHVSQKLAPLADTLDFRIVVIDDRSEFANRARFPQASEFVIPASFEQSLQDCRIDADSYLVIVTRGHLHDKTVLAQALRTPAAYIGMIGSIRKRNAVYDELRAEGFTDEDFKRVHSPIGLKIGAESPEEIAVSIAAELIEVRSGRG